MPQPRVSCARPAAEERTRALTRTVVPATSPCLAGGRAAADRRRGGRAAVSTSEPPCDGRPSAHQRALRRRLINHHGTETARGADGDTEDTPAGREGGGGGRITSGARIPPLSFFHTHTYITYPLFYIHPSRRALGRAVPVAYNSFLCRTTSLFPLLLLDDYGDGSMKGSREEPA